MHYFHKLLYLMLITYSGLLWSESPLSVGIYDNPPQVYRDSAGNPEGIYVELLKEIARLENWDVNFIWGTWAEHLENLKNNNLDLITTIAYDSKRDQYVDYSQEPVVTVWGQIYQQPGESLNNVLDLEGKRIAVMRNGLFGIRLGQLCEKFQVKCDIAPVAGYRLAMKAVSEGNVDAAAINSLFGYAFESEFDVQRSNLIYEPFGLRFAAPEGKHAKILTTIDTYLKRWKLDNQSFYFQTVSHHTEKNNKSFSPPDWLIWLLSGGILVSLFSLLWTLTIRAQQAELSQFRQTLDLTDDCVFMFRPKDLRFIYVNAGAINQFGYSKDEMLKMTPVDIKPKFTMATFKALLETVMEEPDQSYTFETVHLHKNGSHIPVEIVLQYIHPYKGSPRFVAFVRDITRQRDYQDKLEHVANYDALTDLPNRSLLADRLQQAMVQEKRREKILAVAFLDLDGFKNINDAYGHNVGDKLLVKMSERYKKVMRSGDTFARLGGDEFVAVLIDLKSELECTPLVKRLLDSTLLPVHVGDLTLQVSGSIGVTIYPQSEEISADQLLRQADQAMYQAKQAGKNRYQLFDRDQDILVRGHHESIERIHKGLKSNEFVLYYQPKVNLRSGKVIGVEALIRWQHPDRGLLLPAEFLPIIEEDPVSVEVGQWVMKQAITQLADWQKSGTSFNVSVNVSALHLQQPDFVNQLSGLLTLYPDLKHQSLELEVLETSALQDITRVSQIIQSCKSIGVEFALDDFGTGYSSLTYLKALPATILKIDRSFVRDMMDDPEDLAILEGVLGLASAFRRQVIAEGVETAEHCELLLQLGCEQAQGFAIARPMPADLILDWIEQWHPDPKWKSIKAVSKDHISILSANIEHRAWVRSIEASLKNKQSISVSLSSSECQFGRWLEGAGKRNFNTLPGYQQLLPLHEKIHQIGVEIKDCNAVEFNPETLEKFKDMQELSYSLSEALSDLLLENRDML